MTNQMIQSFIKMESYFTCTLHLMVFYDFFKVEKKITAILHYISTHYIVSMEKKTKIFV